MPGLLGFFFETEQLQIYFKNQWYIAISCKLSSINLSWGETAQSKEISISTYYRKRELAT